MTDRERLIELIAQAKDEYPTVPLVNGNRVDFDYFFADYILANGVIVAPMPMAEWLRQELNEHIYKRCIDEL